MCQSLIISNCYFVHLIRIDTIHHQTFYFDFHGFCSDSLLPLLDGIDGPSVGFMSGAQLESRLMVERTMQGGTHQMEPMEAIVTQTHLTPHPIEAFFGGVG